MFCTGTTNGMARQAGNGASPGVDLQQISAVGTITTIGLGGEAGALRPAGGGGALHPAGGGGALRPAGGGGALRPAGGGGLNGDITHQTANSYARPPRNLTIVQEEASPRLIDLSWFAPTFGQAVQYKIYRSAAGGAFTLVTSVSGSQTTYQDTVSCNTGGYRYRVTTVVNNDAGQPLESVPSNIVPGTTEPLLTGCYTVTNFSSPANASGNSTVPITWTLTDDFWITSGTGWANAITTNPVTRPAANTLVAIGPLPKSCKTVGRTTLLLKGSAQSGIGHVYQHREPVHLYVEHERVLLGFLYIRAGFGQRPNSDDYDSIGAEMRCLRGSDHYQTAFAVSLWVSSV